LASRLSRSRLVPPLLLESAQAAFETARDRGGNISLSIPMTWPDAGDRQGQGETY
jgi:hypothetical protein